MTWSAVLGRLLLLMGSLTGALGDDVANPGFLPPVVGDYSPTNCWNFTHGNWQYGEFYSPHYPDNYSNDTECIQTLIAPKGYQIHLDFRDEFHIESEPSNQCKYDFLELRDGPFGYSPKIGRFCGIQHPPMLTSSSRFLWIRFRSDDSIEYQGFRAVYKFSRMNGEDYPWNKNYSGVLNFNISEEEVCRIQVDISNSEGFLSSTQIPKSYLKRINMTGEPLDCTWVIYAPPKHRTSLKFHEYEMISPRRCEESFLEIHDKTTAESSRQKQICGDNAKDQKSLSNHFYLRMFEKNVNTITFKALFTIYLEKDEGIPCPESLYDCGPGDMCINKTLVCNMKINCGTDTDEDGCPNATPPPKTVIPPSATATAEPPSTSPFHHMILGIVSGIILTIILVAIGVTCHQKSKEDRRRKHALKQEEKNAIEMTTLLNKPSPHVTPSHRQGLQRPPGASASSSSTTAVPALLTNGGASPKLNHVGVKKQVPNHTNGLPPRRGGQKESHISDFDVSDIVTEQPTEGVTFRRYLDVGCYNDEDSSPNPSTCNQIPAVVTIESTRRPSREDGPSHDKSSPRPDIINEDKFIYPESGPDFCGRPKDNPRRLSGDTVYSEKSDVWKPMGKVDSLPNHRPGGARSLPRQVTPIRSLSQDYYVPRKDVSPKVPQRSDSMKQTPRSTERHPGRRKAFTPPDSRKTYVGQVTGNIPEMSRPSHSRRTAELARSYSAGYSPEMERSYSPEMGPSYPGRSPELERYHRSAESRQAKRGDSPGRRRGDSPGRKKGGGSKSPDIFYSRPNRSTRQHHPV